MSVYFYVCSKAKEFLNVHKAIFKYCLRDRRRTFRNRHASHKLSLQVGGKTGIWRGGDIGGDKFGWAGYTKADSCPPTLTLPLPPHYRRTGEGGGDGEGVNLTSSFSQL